MAKSRDAFRTISEVSDWLDTPAHVLRFWESKFSQVKPVKRAGGRRYYRPEDMALLGGIKKLLHDDGMTIKGVQKLLRENGVRHVAGLGPALPGDEPAVEATGAEPGLRAPQTPRLAEPEAKIEEPPVEELAETDTRADAAESDKADADEAPHDAAEAAAEASDGIDLSITNVVPLPGSAQGAPIPTPDRDQPETAAFPEAEPHFTVEAEPAAGPEATTEPAAVPGPEATPETAPEPIPAEPEEPEATLETAAALPEALARDPADADSKAGPRLFHLLEVTDRARLRSRTAELAPLVTRMQSLRNRLGASR